MTMSETTTRETIGIAAGQHERAEQSATNVGQAERWVSMAAGALLAGLGIQRQSLPGALIAAVGGAMIYRGATGRCPMYNALGMDTSEEAVARPKDYFDHGIHVAESYLIAKPPQELYDYWRNFENLPRIMHHLEAVTKLDDQRSHWIARAPAFYGGKVEWDAEIINDEPNHLIAWQSLPGADVHNAGSVRFVDTGTRGTEVKVVIEYLPPAGRLGKFAAKLFGEAPEQQIREDLRRFKRIMETGEVPTIEGQSRGSCGRGL